LFGVEHEIDAPMVHPQPDIAVDPSMGLLWWIGVAGLVVGIGATVAE